MSESKKQPIENAAVIIEKFGGIRPMSAKINVAVTTIQGWKKRDAIPATRKDAILEAAVANDIDLSEFFGNTPSVVIPVSEQKIKEVAKSEIKVKDVKPKIPEKKVSSPPVIDDAASKNKAILESNDELNTSCKNDSFTEIAYDFEKKAITKSVLITAAITAVVVGAVVMMLIPDLKERDARIAELEGNISDMKSTQSAFKGLVPENWSEQLNDMKQQVANAKLSVDESVENMQAVSQQFIEANNLEERTIELQTYVSEIASGSGIYSLLARYSGMEDSPTGKEALSTSMLQLSGLFSGAKSNDESYVNGMLNSARSQSAALQTTLGSVPQQELKAAAMLLAMTQVRSALNRSDTAFDSDLNLLMSMIGNDNLELKNTLEKLAPHSKSGVLSVNGLQKEFRTIAGDVVAQSLQGEDISFSEKASARMNDILQIEKDGELITGTKTQNTVLKADKMISTGNLNSAMKYLKRNLNSKELKPLRPFLKQLEAAISSRKVKKAIEQAIELNVGSGYLGGKQLLGGE